jgi:hypothetical protein
MAIIPNEEKVFMVSNGTNTTYSGSASLKAMQEWYTMQDVTDTVRPYQVFTALLTQSGGDDPTAIDEGLLNIGTTYRINNDSPGMDFTNVGAPNNDEGTYFIATGTTPNSWGSNEGTGNGTLTYNTGAPVATVLENTIGNIWFTYSDVGSYNINSNGLFITNKTIPSLIPQMYTEAPDALYNFDVYPGGLNSMNINSYYNNEPSDDRFGGYAQNAIEIRVYN